MKWLTIFSFLVFAGFSEASVKLSAQQAVDSVKAEFLGYSSFSGISRDGSNCEISILDLEGLFSGLQIRVIDSTGKITAVNIESSLQNVFKSTNVSPTSSTTVYEIVDEDGNDSSLIRIFRPEDVSSFDLELTPSTLKNISVVCSFSE